jgi:hypothetical protein
MTTKSKSTEKRSLVQRIMAVLGLDDAGKIQKFFDREKKSCEKKIKALETNKNVAKMNYENELASLHDELEDKQDSYEDAKLAITPEDVNTNSEMDYFSSTYWENLKSKLKEIELIEKKITKIEENYIKEIAELDSQIQEYKDRISIIEELK